jgi:hypothetical protein
LEGGNDERKRDKTGIHCGQGKENWEEYLLKGRKGKIEWKSRSKGRRKNGRH